MMEKLHQNWIRHQLAQGFFVVGALLTGLQGAGLLFPLVDRVFLSRADLTSRSCFWR